MQPFSLKAESLVPIIAASSMDEGNTAKGAASALFQVVCCTNVDAFGNRLPEDYSNCK